MDNDVKTTLSGGGAGICLIIGSMIPGLEHICMPLAGALMMVWAWLTNKKD